MRDLDLLRDVGRLLDQPAFEEIVRTRHRRSRRAWVAGTSAAAAAAAVVTVVTLAAAGPKVRTDLPPVDRSRTPTASPSPSFGPPPGQQTLAPGLGLDDVHGFDVLATVTSSQPAHDGDAELSTVLSAVVPDTRGQVSTYCRGSSDLWWFVDIGDGGGAWDRCAPDSPTTLAPELAIDDQVVRDPLGPPQTIRMWVARPSSDWLRCQREGGSTCLLSDVAPLADPPADFGFEVYAHEPTLAFHLLDDAGNGAPYPIQALSAVGGSGWLVDRAVVAAPDAERLVLELPASPGDRLVDVYRGVSRHLEQCRRQHADELPDRVHSDSQVYAAAFDQVCGFDLRLVVDGAVVQPARDPHAEGHFQPLGAMLPSGSSHRLVVEVVRGDARNAQYGVVVRNRTRLP